jgi:hypothetical protein
MSLSMRAGVMLAVLFGAATAVAQTSPEKINVPLSRPADPMSLRVDILSARIEVIGEDRKDVELTLSTTGNERKLVTPSGTKSLPGGSTELSVDERDNVVRVDSESPMVRVQVVARVPRRANLKLSTVNNGEIIVRDVTGTLELENVNGPVSANNINGSAIIETINRAIDVSFTGVSAKEATALSSVNGTINLALPATAGAELHIDSSNGRIDSEFELDVKPTKPVIERSEGRGGVSVRVKSVVVATVNGGGPVIRIKTLNGNIKIGKTGQKAL